MQVRCLPCRQGPGMASVRIANLTKHGVTCGRAPRHISEAWGGSSVGRAACLRARASEVRFLHSPPTAARHNNTRMTSTEQTRSMSAKEMEELAAAIAYRPFPSLGGYHLPAVNNYPPQPTMSRHKAMMKSKRFCKPKSKR